MPRPSHAAACALLLPRSYTVVRLLIKNTIL